MRAVLVVNLKATATTERVRDRLLRELATELTVTEAHTEYREHATALARRAVEGGADLVVALGGDGTVNEVVNGLLTDGPDRALPSLGVIPAGSANVFARSLGIPNDPGQATGRLLSALRAGRRRSVGMGVADGRYFTFCAGAGFDAAVLGVVERLRARGRRSTASLHIRSAVRHYLAGTDRRHPPIQMHLSDGTDLPPLYVAIVSNTSPWTYLGRIPMTPTPRAGFDSGLDVFGLSTFSMVPVIRSVHRLLAGSERLADERWAVSLHDLPELTMTACRPVDFQLDGDYLGRRTSVRFRAVRDALRVVV
jgi:diacylglycerol kinase family enzyme